MDSVDLLFFKSFRFFDASRCPHGLDMFTSTRKRHIQKNRALQTARAESCGRKSTVLIPSLVCSPVRVTPMARKAAPKKTANKQQQKLAAKQQKNREKNEQIFQKALTKYTTSALEADKLFISQSLEETPGWVQPLAALIRAGALNAMGKAHDTPEESDSATQWKGKAKKWVHVPTEVKVAMLQASAPSVELLKEIVENVDCLEHVFRVQFWLVDATPLAQHPDIRHFETVKQLAKERVADLGRNFLEHQSNLKNIPSEIWTLEDGVLSSIIPGCASVHLPTLPDEGTWELTEDGSANAYLQPEGVEDSPFRFACRSMFPALKMLDPAARWKLSEAASP